MQHSSSTQGQNYKNRIHGAESLPASPGAIVNDEEERGWILVESKKRKLSPAATGGEPDQADLQQYRLPMHNLSERYLLRMFSSLKTKPSTVVYIASCKFR